MKNLFCINCKKEIKKVAYAVKGIGFQCEKCWVREVDKPLENS